eukprot:scaffold2278_cov171-Ochromonas_danica.AAC.5
MGEVAREILPAFSGRTTSSEEFHGIPANSRLLWFWPLCQSVRLPTVHHPYYSSTMVLFLIVV